MQKKYDKLLKADFINKIVYHRLLWKYNITDCTNEDLSKLYDGFFKMLRERDYEKEFFRYEPISLQSFKTLCNVFIDYMKEYDLIDKDTPLDDIDQDYIEAISESYVYAERMYLCCSYFEHDKSIMTVDGMPRVLKHAFYTIGHTTMLELALIYANSNNPKNLPGIGPEKYRKFQEYMALDCEEFEVYDKYNKYNKTETE